MNNALLSLPKAAVAVAASVVLACGLAPAASASGSGMAAAFLAKQGFNSVRRGMSWAAIETCNSYGISTFLEYHQDFYTESRGCEGAPR